MNFDELFPLKVYINLDKRKDRDLQAREEFSKMVIKPIRKSGFVPENISDTFSRGTVGCMVSHYQVIQAALCLNTNVFIFEDDIMMEHKKYNVMNVVNKACNELDQVGEWDFLYLSANILRPFKQVSSHLAKLEWAQSTAAYGINKNFLRKTLDNIDLNHITRPIDVIFSEMDPTNNFYITVTMLGI